MAAARKTGPAAVGILAPSFGRFFATSPAVMITATVMGSDASPARTGAKPSTIWM
jgi:hypothetical protein